MSIYSIELSSTSVGTASPLGDFKAGSSNQPRIVECGIGVNGVTTTIGLGRASNTPVQLGGSFCLPDNPNDPVGLSSCSAAWTIAPTIPTQFFRRVALAPSGFAGIIWSFPRGIIVPPTGDIVLWNIVTGSPPEQFHFVEDE